MTTTPGPYKYGHKPPSHLMGWRPDLVADANEKCKTAETYFRIFGGPENPQLPPIWTFTKQLNGGQHLPTFEQKIGDCVAAGIRQAGARLQVAEIALRYQEEKLKPWFVPFIYGISRVQIGGGQLNGDGSTGAWGAQAVKEYGVLFDDDDKTPEYSGHISRAWGNPPGPPTHAKQIAVHRPVTETARLTTLEQLRAALLNFYPCTIASDRGFRMEPEERNGFHVFVEQGTWYHQMALIAWMDDPFPAAYRLNSWGPDAHGKPLCGEPPGGAWCTAQTLASELANHNNEIFTYSTFNGFPAIPNHGIIK